VSKTTTLSSMTPTPTHTRHPGGKLTAQQEELKACDKSTLLLKLQVKNRSHFV